MAPQTKEQVPNRTKNDTKMKQKPNTNPKLFIVTVVILLTHTTHHTPHTTHHTQHARNIRNTTCQCPKKEEMQTTIPRPSIKFSFHRRRVRHLFFFLSPAVLALTFLEIPNFLHLDQQVGLTANDLICRNTHSSLFLLVRLMKSHTI